MAITDMPEHLSTNESVVQQVGDEFYVCNTVAVGRGDRGMEKAS